MTLDKPITKSGLYGAIGEQLKKVNQARLHLITVRNTLRGDHPIVREAWASKLDAEAKAFSLMFRYVGMREEVFSDPPPPTLDAPNRIDPSGGRGWSDIPDF